MIIASLNDDSKRYIQHSEYTAYTDGSKIEGKARSRIIIYHKNTLIYRQSYNLPSTASVYQAELEVIKQAAHFFNTNRSRYPAKYI